MAAGGAKPVREGGELLATSYDRSLLAEGLPNGEIRVTEVQTRQTVAQLGRHDAAVLAVAFSRDGKRLLSGSADRTPKVWDLPSGAEIATLRGHRDKAYSVTFSPDGRRIVSGGNDASILIWDAETFEQLTALTGHTSYVHSVCFSPDGTILASGSGDGTVRVWDSVLPVDRWQEVQSAQRQRRNAAAMVDELLDPLAVADYLRADDTLDDEHRRAGLRVLLQRTTGLPGGAQHNATP